MKRLVFALVTMLILVTAGSAQSGSFIVADVPFAFHARDNHAPASTYRISYQGSSNDYLVLTNKAGVNIVAGLVFSGKQSAGSAIPKLVFHRYGEEYFLVAVRMADNHLQAIPVSTREMITHRLVTKGQPEEVTVLAQVNK